MKKIILSGMITSAILSQNLQAAEILGKQLEIYGKVHLSADFSDKDDPSVSNDGFSVSSNSSRVGFKGEHPLGEHHFIFQFEQEVVVDETGSTFATRNTFGGLKGDYGKIIAGHHDTPFKTLGSQWGLFSDTVGDRRTILGASYNEGNQLNERAQNALLYEYSNPALVIRALYAIDPESGSDGAVDDNDKDVVSMGARYKAGLFDLGLAYETWQRHSRAADVDAGRIYTKYKFGPANLGLIYETIDSDTMAQWDRDAYGVNVDFQLDIRNSIKAQYLVADDSDSGDNTGASSISLGIFQDLNNYGQIYLVYTTTDNESNAAFQGVDGGHGDEVTTVNGGNPNVISAGLVFGF